MVALSKNSQIPPGVRENRLNLPFPHQQPTLPALLIRQSHHEKIFLVSSESPPSVTVISSMETGSVSRPCWNTAYCQKRDMSAGYGRAQVTCGTQILLMGQVWQNGQRLNCHSIIGQIPTLLHTAELLHWTETKSSFSHMFLQDMLNIFVPRRQCGSAASWGSASFLKSRNQRGTKSKMPVDERHWRWFLIIHDPAADASSSQGYLRGDLLQETGEAGFGHCNVSVFIWLGAGKVPMALALSYRHCFMLFVQLVYTLI